MKIAIVLSGGGVLGAAHVGPLEELDRLGVRPDFIVGTSAGAIIGLLYAANGVQAVNEFLDRLISLFTIPKAYLLNTPLKIFNQLGSILSDYVPRDHQELLIPFFPVAANLRTGSKRIFTDGDLIAEVLASSAYPGVFPLQIINDEPYADGGLIDNLPADAARELGAVIVIGSSIYSLPELPTEKIKKLNLIKLAQRAIDIQQVKIAAEQEALCDFCFQPPVMKEHQWYRLNAIAEIRDQGRKYARSQTDDSDFPIRLVNNVNKR